MLKLYRRRYADLSICDRPIRRQQEKWLPLSLALSLIRLRRNEYRRGGGGGIIRIPGRCTCARLIPTMHHTYVRDRAVDDDASLNDR